MEELGTKMGRKDASAEVLREARTARAAVQHLWEAHRITYRPIVMVVFAMALYEGKSYEEALEDWADYEQVDEGHHWPASRWHSEICYRLLKAGAEAAGGVPDWMQQRAKEVRELADRVSA